MREERRLYLREHPAYEGGDESHGVALLLTKFEEVRR